MAYCLCIKMFVLSLFLFAAVCELSAVPIVLKESSPNGEAVIAISSSDPQLEKYILDYASRRGARERSPADPANSNTFSNNPRSVVQSFSVATPQRTIAGTGRSFGGSNQPFLLPLFITPNLEGFELNNWFRNIEPFYDPSYVGNRASAAASASGNGRAYSSAQSSIN